MGSTLSVFDLSKGRLDKLIKVTSRYDGVAGEHFDKHEEFSHTLDVRRTIREKGKRFCFVKTTYAEPDHWWFNPPRVTHPCYSPGKAANAR